MTEHVQDEIAPYVLGTLHQGERTAVEAHLEGCASCALLRDEAESVAGLLPYAATPYKVPPDLKQALFGKLAAERAGGSAGSADPEAMATRSPLRVLEPPVWARPDIGVEPWWSQLVWRTLPLTAAVAGWLVAAVLFLYSRGQQDRISTTERDLRAQVAGISGQLAQLREVQSYLHTPGIAIRPLSPARHGEAGTSVALFMAPHYAHGLVVARGLTILPSDEVYEVWARKGVRGSFEPLGTLTTGGPRADGATIIAGKVPLESYTVLGLSVEHTPGAPQPTSPMIFTTEL